MNEEQKKKIDASDIVSFDVFDTLLARRTVHPRDVFTVARELFNEQSPYTMSEDFHRLRFDAERDLRRRQSTRIEVTLDEIYEAFGASYGYSKDFCETLKKYEIEAELMMLMRDPSTREIYDYAVAQHKKIIIISDMYLPKELIARLLRKNGIDTWHDLLVSADDQVAKFAGTSYAEIIRRYPGERVVHVGDNIHSDVGWSQRFGFDAIHIHSNIEALSFELRKADRAVYGGDRFRWTQHKETVTVSDVQFNILSGLTAQYCMLPDITVAKAVGYSFFGPLLLSFVQWLDGRARSYGADHVFFLARDGAIMRDAYNAYYGAKALHNTYMLGSRRLINYPSMHKDLFSVNGVNQIAGGNEAVDIRQTLRYYHIDPESEAVKRAIEQVGLTDVETAELGEKRERFIALLLLLEPQMLAQSKLEAKEVLRYLKHIGFMRAKRPLLCDVGWSGSMQVALGLLTDRQVQAAYFGICTNERSLRLGAASMGYFDARSGDPQDAAYEKMFLYSGLLIAETLFTHPDQGTIIGLKRSKSGEYEGVEGDFENDAHDRSVVRTMHEAALQFIQDFAAMPLPRSLKLIRREVALRPLEWIVYRPNDEVAELFGKIKFADIASSVPERIGYPKHDPAYYKSHEHQVELAEEYKRSNWQQGFAKNCVRLGIRLP